MADTKTADSKAKTPKTSKAASDTPKVMDVSRVSGAASGTSKSIIVNNRPILKDPMMADEESQTSAPDLADSQKTSTAEAEATDDSKITVRVNRIEPPSEETKNPETTKPAADPKAAETTLEAPSLPIEIQPANPEPTADKEAETKPEEIPKLQLVKSTANLTVDAPAEKPETTEPATTNAETNEASSDETASAEPPEPAKAGAQAAEAQTATDEVPAPSDSLPAETDSKEANSEFQLEPDGGKSKTEAKPQSGPTPEQQKIIDSGQYYLPIKTAESRRLRREIVLSIVFVLVLTAVWLDVMLDAGLLSVGGLKALTDFFPN